MTDFVMVANVLDVPLNSARAFELAGRKIAVYHTPKGFFASDNSCPHRGGPLAEGDIMGGEIVCPWHLWSFDIETGVNSGIPELSLVRHDVRVENDAILVRVHPVVTEEEMH
ncbi:MAG TPA: Rieske 2Fe-2S domain-containing protein [Thermoanaerobaculia bacterium]|nr:Rieske 2Fe-2S domain-containing protein [Thermoanaerobaculia bacterium]